MSSDNVIDLARREMASIDAQISRLRSERAAWETIIRARGEHPISIPTSPVPNNTPIQDVKSSDSARPYGDKTGTLRKFVLAQNGSGVSRADIVAKAKTFTDNPNFPYRFISRMVEAEELHERDGRFFATDKMRQRVAEIAA